MAFLIRLGLIQVGSVLCTFGDGLCDWASHDVLEVD